MGDIFLSNLEALKKRQATILDAVAKIASCISDPEKAREATRLAEELPKIFEGQNLSIVERNHFNSLKLARNEANRSFLQGKARAMKEALQKLAEGLSEAGKSIPEPKGATVPKPVPPPQKNTPPAPTLLSAQQLRDQIIQKIQSVTTPPPRTTGNIWENWTQSHPETPPTKKERDKDNQP